MSWKQSLAWPLHRLKETLRVYPYTQPQTYELTYSIHINQKADEPITAHTPAVLAIPLPTSTPEQTITDLVLHFPTGKELIDPIFGNRLLIISIEPRSTSFEVPIFSCKAKVKPYDNGKPPGPPESVDASTRGSTTTPKSNTHLHPTDPRIQTLAKNIGQGSSHREIAKNINNHLIKTLTYGDPLDGLYSDLDALLRPRVDCGGFDTLFVSLCLANNIPARVVSGFFLDGHKNDMHAWAEFQDEKDCWIPVDPSTEQLAKQHRSRKSGRFGYVGSDRVRLSHGCDIPLEWNNKICHAPILQHPFVMEGREEPFVRGRIQIMNMDVTSPDTSSKKRDV